MTDKNKKKRKLYKYIMLAKKILKDRQKEDQEHIESLNSALAILSSDQLDLEYLLDSFEKSCKGLKYPTQIPRNPTDERRNPMSQFRHKGERESYSEDSLRVDNGTTAKNPQCNADSRVVHQHFQSTECDDCNIQDLQPDHFYEQREKHQKPKNVLRLKTLDDHKEEHCQSYETQEIVTNNKLEHTKECLKKNELERKLTSIFREYQELCKTLNKKNDKLKTSECSQKSTGDRSLEKTKSVIEHTKETGTSNKMKLKEPNKRHSHAVVKNKDWCVEVNVKVKGNH